MQEIRIMPCPNVKEASVVKGVRFVNLRDARDHVEVAQVYYRHVLDELVFLDLGNWAPMKQEELQNAGDIIRRR